VRCWVVQILGHALMGSADLQDDRLVDTRLAGADLSGTNFLRVIYEPVEAPSLVSVVKVRNLDWFSWDGNPGPAFGLRKALLEAGFSGTASEVTAAIRRHDESHRRLADHPYLGSLLHWRW